jgi:phosphoribosylanthranilate isomerase
MTRVKICGITRMEDAQHAVACGAEMLGFNFYRRSPRYIDPECAAEITSSVPPTVETVGVFVNEQSPDRVRQLATIAGISSVQLHGEETPDFCAALSDLHVIKALRVGDEFNMREVAAYADCRILLDSATPAFGGSGAKFDWEIAREVRQQVAALILAGGLDAVSVVQAIATVQPDAVDACSLLESSPGIKDPNLVHAFIAAAHAERIRFAARSQE